MTNQTIHPCPVCGTVPIHINDHEAYYYAKCQCEYPKHVTKTPVDCWPQICWIKLGKYVAEALDIHTIAQLNARLAPDPRVAVLDNLINQAKSISSSARYAAPEMRHMIFERAMDLVSQLIAAQRGEG